MKKGIHAYIYHTYSFSLSNACDMRFVLSCSLQYSYGEEASKSRKAPGNCNQEIWCIIHILVQYRGRITHTLSSMFMFHFISSFLTQMLSTPFPPLSLSSLSPLSLLFLSLSLSPLSLSLLSFLSLSLNQSSS